VKIAPCPADSPCVAAVASADPRSGAVRRAAPRLTYIAGLLAFLLTWPEHTGGAWDVLGAMAAVVLLKSVGRCLSPSWVRYVRTGEKPPGWLAAEAVGDWDVVLDAAGRRPVETTRVVRQGTGGDAVLIHDAVVGAPSTVASGVWSPAADRLVAALTAVGASAHKQARS